MAGLPSTNYDGKPSFKLPVVVVFLLLLLLVGLDNFISDKDPICHSHQLKWGGGPKYMGMDLDLG